MREVWSMTVTICRLRPSRIQEVTDLEQKSMKNIVEHYGGQMVIKTEQNKYLFA